ncbi:TIGR03619 family F420-dependent LLM class oxidoreductase [Ruania zhangjianzhongii]|uniref:TIGR03619 family F420-dependent LLM class oxidoreductase n=1 Tax=Ruania zhangjianzhongii TaxID=2603206 RepID=UPI001AEF3F96|nr:TIGR03619 family F420-dependent LLM class oxidoreductase [Ruania zhangjianzhongii]
MSVADWWFGPGMELQVILPDESPQMPARTLVDLARAAEQLGYATAWLPEHILPPAEYGPTFGGVYEPLVTIGHLSAVTEHLRFGTSVLVAPLRNPFVLAKQVVTLHELSGGRVILGLGVGWSAPEFKALGADISRRGAVTDDVLALLRHLFAGGQAPYRGRRFGYEQGVFAPVPAEQPPIMIGGNSDAALRRAARYGDIWQGLPASPERFAERATALAELASERTITPSLRIGWDNDEPVEQIADSVLAYREAGAAQVAVHFGEYSGTFGRMEALAEKLAERV